MEKLTKKQRELYAFRQFFRLEPISLSGYTQDDFLLLCKLTRSFLRMKKIASEVEHEYLFVKENERRYQRFFQKEYDEILEKWVDLFLELNFESTLDIVNFFLGLMMKGYFSTNHKYCYDENNRASIDGWYSLDVIAGSGVCLSESDLLKDFLLKMGIDAAVMVNYVNGSYADFSGMVPKDVVKRVPPTRFGKQKLIFNLKWWNSARKSGNHAIVLIKDEKTKQLLLVDPTNLALATVVNPTLGVSVNGKVKYRLKPYLSHALVGSKQEFDLLTQLFDTKHKPTRSFLFQNKVSWINAKFVYKENKRKLDECYRETQPQLDSIGQQINMIKMKRR